MSWVVQEGRSLPIQLHLVIATTSAVVDDVEVFLLHQAVAVVPFNDGGRFIGFPCPTPRRPRIFPCKQELFPQGWTYLERCLIRMARAGTITEKSATPMAMAILILMSVSPFTQRSPFSFNASEGREIWYSKGGQRCIPITVFREKDSY